MSYTKYKEIIIRDRLWRYAVGKTRISFLGPAGRKLTVPKDVVAGRPAEDVSREEVQAYLEKLEDASPPAPALPPVPTEE
jgi:hypothetical protein